MIAIELAAPDDFETWRVTARRLAEARIAPDRIAWRLSGTNGDLFAQMQEGLHEVRALRSVRASRLFIEMAQSAILHVDPARFDLLYRLLWRLQDEPRLIDDAADPQVARALGLARQVRREIHKMRAFVRFRTLREEDGEDRYVAWFEPEHYVERANLAFFAGRFASQRWSILTPRLSLHWNGHALHEGPGATRNDAPSEDATEDLWLGYYRSIFNPARLKIGTMLREMPRRYWKNMPEAREIGQMIAGAQAREAAMIDAGSSRFDTLRLPDSLDAVATGIAACRRCAIGCNGTRAVMGEGPPEASLMIVGEQPGDTEEASGRAFVGPAGQVLDQMLAAAGIARSQAYVTNAVKHFKFTPQPHGKRRLHQNPTAGEIDTCRWWLDAERTLVRPRVILPLGASAGRALTGRTPSVARERGGASTLPDGSVLWQTIHPSYLLRLDGEAGRREETKFADDLTGLAGLLEQIA
ncbi:UdgX family uracil-DNA binding protein [Novosphingobium sp. 9]|uniref:UdgX family uracil-DNA binding protein n=1 Tax=Novosphingobium sp. 9 TaxID=2025349 RepID=UPI0021B6A9AD|nr:UdgX family uracil-DNA binding protein [Novosphingobium sp. 9]